MIRKNYTILVVSILMLALIMSGAQVLHKEWRTEYTLLFQTTFYKVNLIRLKLTNLFEGTYRPLVASREPGLPEVRLYISEKSRNALMVDMPANTKNWQQALRIYPDGKLYPIKVRLRGDNPVNWAYNRKSWRIKTRKKHLINKIRVFDYVVPQEKNHFNMYLSYYFGKLAGILTPEIRLVELYINDKSQGIYNEKEQIDESFLRNHELMPINIYKGEQENRERQITIGINLYDNPGLWSKVAVFNQAKESDFSDLKYVLNLIRKAETSDDHFSRLKRVARFADWARFSAYQTLTQSTHNSAFSNNRLVSDPWRGTVQLVVHDTGIYDPLGFSQGKTFPIDFDGGYPQPLLALYQRSSEFLLKKYKILYEFVKNKITLQGAQHVESLLPAVKRSFSRENYRYEKVYINEHLVSPYNLQYSLKLTTDEGMEEEWNKLIDSMRWYQEELENRLSANPTAKWMTEDGVIGLIIDGPLPVSNVTLSLASGSSLPKTIAWDSDGNGEISTEDIQIPFQTEGNKIILEADWMANRVLPTSGWSHPDYPLRYVLPKEGFKTVPTQFWLVADTEIELSSMQATNSLTKEPFPVLEGSLVGNTPSRRNHPVIMDIPNTIQIWPMDLTVKKVRVVDQPVKILPGTVIRMMPGASLIFRNRVQIEGTEKAPVVIISAKDSEPWGTVAFHGPQTKGSIISHLTLENGSGAKVESVRYIGMLSVHEASNLLFNGIRLKRNHIFDDMMHVVYSKNIQLQNCLFTNAFSDGLDIDISNVRISGCRFENSGNDGIDLMTSQVLIENSEILTSGDKAVSVGEGSDALIFNSTLTRNMIGVESKDGSTAHFINGLLDGNKIQLNAYSKNWRYETGGVIVAEKSVFKTPQNRMSAKKQSNIKVFDSMFSPNMAKKEKRVSVDALSDTLNNKTANSPRYTPDSMAKLNRWNLSGSPGLRGRIQ